MPFSGPSEYDAFDYEEDYINEEDEDDEGDANDAQEIYSDFHNLESSDSDDEFSDASYSFDTPDARYHDPVDPGEKAINLVMENEKQREVSIAPIGHGIISSFLPKVAIFGD